MNNVVTRKASTCRACGGSYPNQIEYPAKGKQCRSCGKSNHFAKVCQTPPKKGNAKEEVDQDGDKRKLFNRSKYKKAVVQNPMMDTCMQ